MASAQQIPSGDVQTTPIDSVAFTAFLVDSKRGAQPVGKADHQELQHVLPGSVQLRYSHGLYTYRNTYCGTERFSGQEIVHYDNRPIWGMGYNGGLVSHDLWDLQPQWIYAVLRAALAQVTEDFPYRGPLKYDYYGFEYVNHPIGGLGEFLGEETIHYRDALVYHLWYVGGYTK